MKAMLAAALLLAATLHASDYQADYAALKAKVGKDHLEQHLADWRKREPESPDAWILSANWALEQADGVAIRSTKGTALPQGNYKLEMRNDKIVVIGADGKPAGNIVPDPSQAGIVKAAWYISEGLKKWPYRADMHCGLATVYARGEFWPEHVAALRGLVAAARRQPGKLRWCHNEPLDQSEPEFLADKLHSFAIQQFELENKAADLRFFEIAQITVRACPNSPKGYNDLAVYHGLSKNWKAAQPVLEKAAQVAPDDALVWMNLGDNSVRLHRDDMARTAYQHVLDLKSDAALVKDADAKLEALDKAKP
jgi:tetratricopeptide (TPR) repeat protein